MDPKQKEALERELLELELKELELKEASLVKGQKKEEPKKEEGRVIEEQHPQVSWADRTIIKNFSADPEKSMQYLKEKHPDLDVTRRGGRILVKGKDEQDYRVIDPAGFDASDLSDIGFDIGSGVLETAAIAKGAILGNLPGAAAAGTVAGAASEAVRQKIGKALGLPQEEVSNEDLAISAATGALSPVLFGGGATAKQFAKALAKKGAKSGVIPKHAIEQAINKQKGVLQRGAEFISKDLPLKGGEALSGVPRDVISTYAKNADKIDLLDDDKAIEVAATTGENLWNSFKQERSAIGQQMNEYIRESGKKIDIAPVKDVFRKKIADIEAKGAITAQEKEVLDQLKKQYGEIFSMVDPKTGKSVGEVPDMIGANESFDVKDSLQVMADYFKDNKNVPKGAREIQSLASKAYGKVNDQVDDMLEGAKDLRTAYRENLGLEKDLQKNLFSVDKQTGLRDFSKSYDTFTKLGNQNKLTTVKKLKALDDKYGTNVIEQSNLLRAHKILKDPKFTPVSSGGVVSTGRIAITSGAGGYLGSEADIPGGPVAGLLAGAALSSPAAMKQYIRMSRKLPSAPSMGISSGKAARVAPSVWNMMGERE